MPEREDHILIVPNGALTEGDADPLRTATDGNVPIVTDQAMLTDPAQPVETEPQSGVATPAGDTGNISGETALPDQAEEDMIDFTLFRGGAADDVVLLDPVYTRIDGGEGTDTVVVNGSREVAQILAGTGNEILLDPGPDAPALTLENVERLAFDDGILAFDDEGLAGQAYRLYQACFDRTPDAEGLGFWIKQLDAGSVTLTQAAGHFLGSSEFASVYGAPDDLADVHYLALLYANVLNRVPDQAGFAFWRDQQDKGITRADMLVHFSESAENKALVSEAIDDGIWYF